MNYEIKEIYPWLYSIKDPLNVFCYLVVGENKALLFDTGYGVFELEEAIKTITKKPFIVIMGHGHVDHSCGAYQFKEVYLHEADFKLCREHTSPDFRSGTPNRYIEMGIKLPENFNSEAYINAGTGNLKKLDLNKSIDLGGLNLEIIKMSGHTAGSIGLLAKEKQVLLVSDSASDHIWMFLNESSTLKEYIKMLQRTMEVDFSFFFTGHSNEPKPKTDFLKYIKVASNAAIKKSSPYDSFRELNPYIYQEDGVAIVFNERTLNSCE